MDKIYFTEEEKQEIIKLYSVDKMPSKKLSEQYGCSNVTMLKNLKEWGIHPNSRKLDLSQMSFGELVVLMPAEKKSDKYTRWICRCSCGKITEVRTDYLTNGHTTSCGHIKDQHFYKLDLVGQKFGKLTVIEPIAPIYQKCICDCGNEVIVETSNLTNHNTQSCGCYQKQRTSEATFKSLIGQKFGKLTVVERVENNRFGHVCYRCKCDCGGGAIVDSVNLKGGHTNSCGCIKSKGEMKINQWLTEHDINFIPQYSHDDIYLSSGRRPFFDFAIFNKCNDLMCFIEYQGAQHYGYSGYGWDNEENFKQTIRRDEEHREGCKNLGIPLYEIPYWEFDNIEKILDDVICNIKNTIQND